jgi:hypothetical protein
VIADFKNGLVDLSKNFQKWLSEYNTILQKLANRDKAKAKNLEYDKKINDAQTEKFKL